MDVTFHDVLIRNLLLESRDAGEWLPKVAFSDEEMEYAYRLKFGDDRFSRKILRLVADSVVEAILADPYRNEFRSELRRIRPVVDVRTAFFASSRLLKIAEWDRQDNGEGAGDTYASAARLAEVVGEHYGGMPPEGYEEVAGNYVGAIRGSFDDAVRTVVLKLLADIRTVEERAKKSRSKT